MEQPIIAIKNADVFQGSSLVLREVTFTINKGEFVYLIGKTGTGKSSLLKILYGEIPIAKGTGSVVGFDLADMNWKMLPYLRRCIGIVFQDFQLLTDRTVYDNLRFVMKSTGWKNESEIEQKIEGLLAQVGLKGRGYKMPYEMSGGEQQRVGIARALLNSPELILADEPTGNLDHDTSIEIMQLLVQISKDFNTTVVMATHDRSMIDNFPSRMLKTFKGKVFDSNNVIEKDATPKVI